MARIEKSSTSITVHKPLARGYPREIHRRMVRNFCERSCLLKAGLDRDRADLNADAEQ